MWRNWSGYVSCPHATVSQPDSREALAKLLVKAAQTGASIRVAGAGHSFTPLVQTDGTIVSLDRMQGLIDVDATRRIVRVHAGTRLSTLGAALAQHGLAMENLGDIDVQSIAGATSTGTHGTGITLGNLSTQLASFTIMDADGNEIVADTRQNAELFTGGRIGLGALGIVTELALNVVPSFRLKLQRGKMGLDECLAQAATLVQRHRSFEFYWLPHTDAVLTKAWDITAEPPTRGSWKRQITEDLLENTAFGLLCGIGRRLPSTCPSLSRLCASLLGHDEHVDASHRMLSTARRVRFNEMEWSVPAEQGEQVLREIGALIAKRTFPLMFPIEYRWVRGDDIWLSPDYGRDSVRISVHQYRGMPFEQYFDAVQAICLRYEGRPHWGKVHSLRGKDFAKRYPRWDDFLALRQRMDPHGRFLTPYLRALFGLEHERGPRHDALVGAASSSTP